MNRTELARYIDQTNLKPGMTEDYISNFCKEAKANSFASVCILPNMVSCAVEILKGSNTKVCTVISFPLGMDVPNVKIKEAEEAIKMGAEEIDLVMNVSAFRSEMYEIVEEEILGVVGKCHEQDIISKLIIETPLLTEQQIIKACEIAEKCNVDFVKTSTGFSAMLPRSTSIEDVKLIKKVIKPTTGLKAAGGIKTTQEALAMIEAGATRIGTSSGIEIINGLKD